MSVRYDFAPLEAILAPKWATVRTDVRDGIIGEAIGESRTYVGHLRTRMLSAELADRLAIAAGYHPSLIWPTWFDDAFDDHRCLWCTEPTFNRSVCSRWCKRLLFNERKRDAWRQDKWWKRLDRYRDMVVEMDEAA